MVERGQQHKPSEQLPQRDRNKYPVAEVVRFATQNRYCSWKPPCTQFSYANRGGSGDIIDGLKDIAKFLEVVAYLKPRFWAMENVPRVAKVIPQLFKRGGLLAKYAELNPTIKVLDMSEWGVPQSRKRCIVGNFDFKLLDSYKNYVHPGLLEML